MPPISVVCAYTELTESAIIKHDCPQNRSVYRARDSYHLPWFPINCAVENGLIGNFGAVRNVEVNCVTAAEQPFCS